MNRNLASALVLTGTAAAAFALAVCSSAGAYAGDITIDPTPFVSTRDRAEVAAEVAGQGEALRLATSEAAMQAMTRPASGYTAAQAKADYILRRDEVNALTSEDSGSFYLAHTARAVAHDVILAGPDE